MVISYYPHIKEVKNSINYPVDIFLNDIQRGKWQDEILTLRTTADQAKQQELKQRLPYVTLSGTFSTRNNDGLIAHSGLLAIDVDKSAPEPIKEALRHDDNVYAIFASCRGNGACIVFRIHPKRHAESFDAISEYLWNKYQIVVDQSGKDLSRPRYVSFDPDIYVNPQAADFKVAAGIGGRPSKKNGQAKDVVYNQADFENIIRQITTQKIDLTTGYHNWLKTGFALADKFGESGREYFHTISAISNQYKPKPTDRQYDACLNAKNTGITIASFYYLCHQNNIITESDRVREIAKSAFTHKAAKATLEQSIRNIVKFTDEDTDLVTDIATQIFNKDIAVKDTSLIETGRVWIQNNGPRRNQITGQIHMRSGNALTNAEMRTLELKMREDLPDLDKSDISLLLDSTAVPSFHEINDFFEKYKHVSGTGSIARLAATLNSTTGEGTDYVTRMLTKWLVGAIACLGKEESHTMLVLCGGSHGDGKSHFFKYLLPPELQHLCAFKDLGSISSPAASRDFEIAITKNWLIVDDEMGNKSKRDHSVIKAMLARSYTDVRAAYAKTEEHRKRIAFFGGTSNELDVIPDHGDNRRIIPIGVIKNGIDHAAKDKINPIDYIMEAYHLFNSGYDYRILRDDITFLNQHTAEFKEHTMESELISKRFKAAEPNCGTYMTATDIKMALQLVVKDVINTRKIKAAMKDIGVEQVFTRVNGVQGKYYYVCQLGFDYGLPVPRAMPF